MLRTSVEMKECNNKQVADRKQIVSAGGAARLYTKIRKWKRLYPAMEWPQMSLKVTGSGTRLVDVTSRL